MILCAATMVTGDGSTVLHNAALRVEGTRITEVGSAEKLRQAYPADEVIDYGEATILPGLMDMHVHFGYY